MHFQVQTSPKYAKTYFFDFIDDRFFYPEVPKENCQKFSWTSVKTLEIERVHPEGKMVAFHVQTSPKLTKIDFIDLRVL